MENEFREVMSQRTDEELVKILTVERGKYNLIAIEAAEDEVKMRNIDTSDFKAYIEEVQTLQQQRETVTSNVVGSGLRLVNFIIDMFVWLTLAFILNMIIISILGIKGSGLISLIGYPLFIGTYITYYSLMEIKYQKTVGKLVTNTKVVDLNGNKPDEGKIIARTFCRLIPFDRLSFVFTKNGIHDYLSKTTVIRSWTSSLHYQVKPRLIKLV